MKNLNWKSLLFAAIAVAGIKTVDAATYNIYFNNAEQGNNSKASPTVVVGDDGKPQVQPSPSGEPEKAIEPSAVSQPVQAAPAAPAPAQPTTYPQVTSHDDFVYNPYDHGRYPNFRVMAGGAYEKIHSVKTTTNFNSDPFSMDPFVTQNTDSTTTKTTPSFEASYFWYPTFGASLLVSDLSGFELTFVPFGTPGAHFIQPEISIGLLASLSDITFAGGPEIGARIAFNFTRNVALLVGGRASVVRDGNYNFTQVTAGLAYNF